VTRLRLSVLRLARRIRQRADIGVTPSRLSALATIDRHGAMHPSALAQHERIGKSTVTRLLANLEAQGLVRRVPDALDGRSSYIDLSDNGRELLGTFSVQADAFLAAQVDALTIEERRHLIAAIPIIERLLDLKP
jgi:DNA-binding MarR family transcriptional regulator